jgi:hypothetical protein
MMAGFEEALRMVCRLAAASMIGPGDPVERELMPREANRRLERLAQFPGLEARLVDRHSFGDAIKNQSPTERRGEANSAARSALYRPARSMRLA